jgi:hypothetical protein
MERDEVEKVYIRKGKLNEDGERLDIIKSKATGTEYQPGAIDDKMETWSWRLRQPGDAADMRETRNLEEIPRPRDLRPRNLDSPPLPPHAPHPSASPPSAVSRESSFSRNLDKPLSWAEEYSAKRPSRGRPRKGPLQPRFHMSWGAHWKGNSGTRDIHFASTLQLQLNRDIMSSPPPFPVGQDDTSTIRKPDVPFGERLCQSRADITKLHTQLKLYTNQLWVTCHNFETKPLLAHISSTFRSLRQDYLDSPSFMRQPECRVSGQHSNDVTKSRLPHYLGHLARVRRSSNTHRLPL